MEIQRRCTSRQIDLISHILSSGWFNGNIFIASINSITVNMLNVCRFLISYRYFDISMFYVLCTCCVPLCRYPTGGY